MHARAALCLPAGSFPACRAQFRMDDGFCSCACTIGVRLVESSSVLDFVIAGPIAGRPASSACLDAVHKQVQDITHTALQPAPCCCAAAVP